MVSTETFTAEIEADFVAVVDHTFFRGLLDGSLPTSIFTTFLAEDMRFLRRMARCYAAMASRVEDPGLYALLAGLASGLPGAVDLLYAPAFERHGLSMSDELVRPQSPLNETYLRVMAGYARDGALAEAVGFVLPCLIHHQVIGDRIRAARPELPGGEYGDWLREFGANPHFRGAVRGLSFAFDGLLAADPAGTEAARRAFRLGSHFEVIFWDDFVTSISKDPGPIPRRLFGF